jgi:transketolase
VGLVDWNEIQLSGDNADILPQDIAADWAADGWGVVVVDGHDFKAMFHALKGALAADKPTVLMCRTIMSQGVPFMEKDRYKWHGAALSVEKCREALGILGLPDDLDLWIAERKKPAPDWHAVLPHRPEESVVLADAGTPRTYTVDKPTDNRARLNALADLGGVAHRRYPIAVWTVTSSPRRPTSSSKYPADFHQIGIAEHHTAVMNGALSLSGVASWWGEFAMFGVAESYNQQRLNDVNGTNAKPSRVPSRKIVSALG